MTIHCAVQYFDDKTKSTGYLLGSDSWAAEVVEQTPDETLLGKRNLGSMDKHISGKNSIGLMRGHFSNLRFSEFLAQLQSLENVFDGIEQGIDYSNIPLLTNSKYTSLVGRQAPEFLDLYTISNQRKTNLHIAERLHRLTSDSCQEPYPKGYGV